MKGDESLWCAVIAPHAPPRWSSLAMVSAICSAHCGSMAATTPATAPNAPLRWGRQVQKSGDAYTDDLPPRIGQRSATRANATKIDPQALVLGCELLAAH